LEIITNDDDFNTVYGSAALLKENETRKGWDFRNELIQKLEKYPFKNMNFEQKRTLQNIILLSELNHGENRRNVLNKDQNIIKSDAQYFLDIAYRANRIFDKIKPSFWEKLYTSFVKK
jgi:hypothetical protein